MFERFAFLILLSVFGFLFFKFGCRKLLAYPSYKLELIYLVSLFVVVERSDFVIFPTLFFVIAMSLLVWGLQLWKKSHEYERDRRNFARFLSELVLSMKIGMSFSSSIRQFSGSLIGVRIEKLRQDRNLGLQSFGGNRVDQYMKSLVELSESKFRTLDRVIFLRDQFDIEESFRHRSRAKLTMVRIQLAVISSLYIALLLFYLFFSVSIEFEPVLISLTLFFCGILSLVCIVRRSYEF